MDIEQIEQRLELFSSMLLCCHNIYLWQYDSGFHLIHSNCPHQAAINNLFSMLRGGQLTEKQLANQDTPILLANDIGLMWITQPHLEDGELVRLYVLGPLFLDDISLKNMEVQLNHHDLTNALRKSVMEFLQLLPIISLNRVFEYAIMLHHCVTGQIIRVSDLRYEDHAIRPLPSDTSEQVSAHGTYEAEQEMLRMVREGDIKHFHAHMDQLSITGRMGKLSNDDPLRQMKNAVITCLVLFSRAAMEGGLEPEVSYALSDCYFQSIEACNSISDLAEIALPMQEDYIQRVYRCRTSGLSHPIQSCCDYIEMHLEEPLELVDLAQQAGYTEYYLSRKFKKETGLPPSEYIRTRRLDRAAHLLRTTREDIQKIGAQLQFCSQSHFSECFRKQYGQTPTAYREGIIET